MIIDRLGKAAQVRYPFQALASERRVNGVLHPKVSLTSPEGRARALVACEALRGALRAERQQPPARKRLAAVRERLRRMHKARDQVRLH